jgi:CubicO group peptidase (beta-lactamase class C family)
MTELRRCEQILERGVSDGLHPGAQLYVSVRGAIVVDLAVGEARPGVKMTTDSLPFWFSASKAAAAVLTAMLWQDNRLDLDTRVCDFIPEFARHGKQKITVRHLLTHTAGLRFADLAPGIERPVDRTTPDPKLFAAFGTPFLTDWEVLLDRLCNAAPEAGWEPGRRAGYHPFSCAFLLAEILQRAEGRAYSEIARRHLFEPLGMSDCWIGMPAEQYRRYGERIVHTFATPEGADAVQLALVDSEEGCTRCVPGGNGRGPARQAARLYEMLVLHGQIEGTRVLAPQTVEALTARHRVGMKDETFGVPIDWGLGLIIDSPMQGRHASPRSYGHGGGQSSIMFADPEVGLVAVVLTNGWPGLRRHFEEFDCLCSAIYEELGLGATAHARDRSLTGSFLA